MKRIALSVAALALIASPLAFRSAPNLADEIQGAWKVVEITNAEGETNEITGPNLAMFTDGHYSSFWIGSEEPREPLPEEPTDEQRLEAFGQFHASAGTYSLSGDELTTTVMMHRNPNVMVEGRTRTSRIEIDGDRMVRTFTNTESGAQFIVRLKRR